MNNKNNTITPHDPPKSHVDEIWTSVKGYEDKYQISNYGNVYSNVSRKVLKQTINQVGYYQISLSLNGKTKRHKAFKALCLIDFNWCA